MRGYPKGLIWMHRGELEGAGCGLDRMQSERGTIL